MIWFCTILIFVCRLMKTFRTILFKSILWWSVNAWLVPGCSAPAPAPAPTPAAQNRRGIFTLKSLKSRHWYRFRYHTWISVSINCNVVLINCGCRYISNILRVIRNIIPMHIQTLNDICTHYIHTCRYIHNRYT